MNFNTPSGAVIFLLTSLLLPTADYTNAELCSDDSNATSMCRVDADCIRKFHCVNGQCCSRNCADGTPSPAKCSEMKNCPPNHACHRGQCCSLFTNKRKTSLCPDGTPTSIRCNEKNRCDTGAECVHGFCCSKVHAPPAKQGRCPILLTFTVKVFENVASLLLEKDVFFLRQILDNVLTGRRLKASAT
ncbi:Stigma-specific STIG1-like protein [Trichinella pseudospiralis]